MHNNYMRRSLDKNHHNNNIEQRCNKMSNFVRGDMHLHITQKCSFLWQIYVKFIFITSNAHKKYDFLQGIRNSAQSVWGHVKCIYKS